MKRNSIIVDKILICQLSKNLMNKILLVVIVLGHVLFIPHFASAGHINEQRTVKIMQLLLKNTSHSEYDAVWPGFKMKSKATIITLKNGHVYAFDLLSQDPRWSTINVEGEDVLFSAVDHWGFTKFVFTVMPVEDKIALIMAMELSSEGNMFLIFSHERFHLYQSENFEIERSTYADHLNIENLLWMHVELQLLKEYLKTDVDHRERRIEFLKNFISVHKMRLGLISPSSHRWEDAQQKIEGLADYVAFKNEEHGKYLKNFDSTRALIKGFEESSRTLDQCDHAIKWRHYPVGATLAFALDDLYVQEWKKIIEKKDQSLFNLLEQALPMDEEEMTLRVETVKGLYDLEPVRQFMNDTRGRYIADLEAAMDVYRADASVELSLGKPQSPLLGGAHADRTFYLSSGSLLQKNRTGVISMNPGGWQLSTTNLPILFINEHTLDFKIEREGVFEIDGVEMVLDDILRQGPFSICFVNLRWATSKSTFESKEIPGKICVENGKVLLEFF